MCLVVVSNPVMIWIEYGYSPLVNRIVISPSLLALVTLGGMTEIETILSVSCLPRWPMQVLFHVTVAVAVASIIA